MKYSSKDLKAMARTQLTGKYGIFIGAYVLYNVITEIVSLILNFAVGIPLAGLGMPFYLQQQQPSRLILYFLFMVLITLILSILSLGFNKMFLDGSRGLQVRFEDLFYGFRHHPDRVILMQFLMLLINLACILPGFVLMILGMFNESVGLLITSSVLMLAAFVPVIYFSLAFSQAMYLMADYDDLGAVQALKESRRLMVGNKGRMFYLQLSFIGLSLLGILSCGLGLLWVFPYQSMTFANFYRNLGNEI
ncbi:MAG: DUF975 family protein [Clostridiales bacterium]|nr:DUF975 family protein [Clostridiales bacterium]